MVSIQHQIFLTTVVIVSFLTYNNMTLSKYCACAKTGLFQDVFKLQDKDFKQYSVGEKPRYVSLGLAVSMKALKDSDYFLHS